MSLCLPLLSPASASVSSQFPSCLIFIAHALMFTANIPNFLLILTSISPDIQHFKFPDNYFWSDLLPWSGPTGTVVLHWLLSCPCGVRTYSPYRESFNWSLSSLFVRMCSFEVVPPAMTTETIFILWIIEWHPVLNDLHMHPPPADLVFSTILLVPYSRQFVVSSPSLHSVICPLQWLSFWTLSVVLFLFKTTFWRLDSISVLR
jgi:hypothetical protein